MVKQNRKKTAIFSSNCYERFIVCMLKFIGYYFAVLFSSNRILSKISPTDDTDSVWNAVKKICIIDETFG